MRKLYKDRDWLWEHYIVRGESMAIAAKEAKCNPATIRYWLRKMDISSHVYGGLWHDQDWLWEHCIVQKKSMSTMAKEAGCAPTTILRRLHGYEIPVRGCGEGYHLLKGNFGIIVPDLFEFMEGEILGDGHLEMHSRRAARYSHGSKYEKYLIWLSECFSKWGIKQAGQITRHKHKQNGAIYYNYTTRSYEGLVPICKRWYPNGKRTIPKDLRLTPIMARQWHLGDGCLKHPDHARPHIVLSTHSFDILSVDYLVKELGKLGFKATRRPSKNTIHISTYSTKEFLEWIGPCPVSCYDYRRDYENKLKWRWSCRSTSP